MIRVTPKFLDGLFQMAPLVKRELLIRPDASSSFANLVCMLRKGQRRLRRRTVESFKFQPETPNQLLLGQFLYA